MVGNEIQETLVIENDEQARSKRSQCKYIKDLLNLPKGMP